MITQEQLKELLHYNPNTGIFVWINGRTNGKVAGYINLTRYIDIRIDGKAYKAHRLAWLYVHGKFPDNLIDHINGVKDDNRIINLRPATHAQNLHNQKINIKNTSGLKGVYWHNINNKWIAKITVDGVSKYLGSFMDKHEAHKCYCAAADKYHGEFANYGVTV